MAESPRVAACGENWACLYAAEKTAASGIRAGTDPVAGSQAVGAFERPARFVPGRHSTNNKV